MRRVRSALKILDKVLFPDLVYFENKIKKNELKLDPGVKEAYLGLEVIPYMAGAVLLVFINPIIGVAQAVYSTARLFRHRYSKYLGDLPLTIDYTGIKQSKLDPYLRSV